MADQLKLRGGSEDASNNFTGGAREVTVDTTDWTLRVHDGVTPGGHKLLKSGNCLVVETADKCNPDKPECQVTVNGDLDIKGDLTIEGALDIGNLVIDLETNHVVLKNPGDYTADCNVPEGKNLKTQAEANKWFYQGIAILDRELCTIQGKVSQLEQDVKDLDGRVDENEKDITAIYKEIANLKQEAEDFEGAVKLLEIEIEKNQEAIEENAKDIVAIKKDIETIFGRLDALDDWIKKHKLDEHTDVELGVPSEGDFFVYKNGKWTNEKKCFFECHTYIQSLTSL